MYHVFSFVKFNLSKENIRGMYILMADVHAWMESEVEC